MFIPRVLSSTVKKWIVTTRTDYKIVKTQNRVAPLPSNYIIFILRTSSANSDCPQGLVGHGEELVVFSELGVNSWSGFKNRWDGVMESWSLEARLSGSQSCVINPSPNEVFWNSKNHSSCSQIWNMGLRLGENGLWLLFTHQTGVELEWTVPPRI